MKEKTLSVFKRLESQRMEIIDKYGRLTPEQLRYKPSADQWNLLQVLRHLVTAEKQSLSYIQRKLKRKNEIPKTGAGATIRHVILIIALILPIKYKAPKIADVREESPNLEEMKMEWKSVREEMKSLIENSNNETLTKSLYKHPRAGLLNIKQALEFMETHITHHQKQMNRLIRN